MNTTTPNPFYLKNCSLASIATGVRANSLLEFRDKLAAIDSESLYYHFWSRRLNPEFTHQQHHNDFAYWVYHRLHDHVLAEQLSIIDPTEFESIEALRQEVIEIIEKRLDDYEIILWTTKENQFHFIRSRILIFETSFVINHPNELPKAIPLIPPSSIFYHFIDARSRTPERIDDFSMWLKTYDGKYNLLIEQIHSIDPYFLSLTELREELTKITSQHLDKEEKQ